MRRQPFLSVGRPSAFANVRSAEERAFTPTARRATVRVRGRKSVPLFMERDQAANSDLLAHYEGLVRTTANRYVGIVDGMDFDDICQVLRVKVWQALLAYDPAKCRTDRDRYVFMCVRNRAKDLVKRQKTEKVAMFIEDVAPMNGRERNQGGENIRHAFELRYLSAAEEQVFAEVEDAMPLIPSTLSSPERKVVTLRYLDYSHGDIAEIMHIEKREVAKHIRSIRTKMADWRPTPVVVQPEAVAA